MFKILLLIFAAALGNGQISESVYSEDTTELDEDIAGSAVTSITNVYSNAFAATVDSVSWMPLAVARALGPATLPIPVSNTNNIDIIDKFVKDFNEGSNNEDAKLRLDELLIKYGFQVQIHEVETKDGYVLKMHRIPNNGPVVFLMHELLGSADDFVIVGRDSGLAYLLAEAGYDVWLGNARGSKHSRRHTILEPSQASFWDFSWHEIGVYDLPAMIDSILNKTNKESLKYIGHSQGTTAFFVMTSEIPEYNKKVSLMIALSPVAYTAHLRTPLIRLLVPGTSIVQGLYQGLGVYEFLPDNNLMRTLKLLICGTGVIAELLCTNTAFLFTGFDYSQLNVTNLPVIFGHVPAGASFKQLIHYAQGISGKDFRKFDYGSAENYKRYKVKVPLKYALENVVTPVALFSAEEDWLAHPIDVDRLSKRLSNVVDDYKIPYKQFSHLDFVFAKDVKSLVYKRVLKVLSSN